MLTFLAAREGYWMGPLPGLTGHCCANVSAKRPLSTKRKGIAGSSAHRAVFWNSRLARFAFLCLPQGKVQHGGLVYTRLLQHYILAALEMPH